MRICWTNVPNGSFEMRSNTGKHALIQSSKMIYLRRLPSILKLSFLPIQSALLLAGQCQDEFEGKLTNNVIYFCP